MPIKPLSKRAAEALSRVKNSCIIDLKGRLKSHFFESLRLEDKAGSAPAIRRLYHLMDGVLHNENVYFNSTYLNDTLPGRLFLLMHFQNSGLPVIPTVVYLGDNGGYPRFACNDIGRIFLDTYLAKGEYPNIPEAFLAAKDEDDPRAHLKDVLATMNPRLPKLLVKKSLQVKRHAHFDSFPAREVETAFNDANRFDLFQPFVYCPYKDGFQRDFKFFVIGDEVVGFYERRAVQPLVDITAMKLWEYPPAPTRVRTHPKSWGQSRSIEIKEAYRDMIELALRAKDEVRTADQLFRREWGALSGSLQNLCLTVDIMRDSEGNTKLVTVHTDFDRPVKGVLDEIASALVSTIDHLFRIRDLRNVILLDDDVVTVKVAKRLSASKISCIRENLSELT